MPLFYDPVSVADVAYLPLYETTPNFDDLSIGSPSFQEEVDFILQEPIGYFGPMSRARHWCFTLNNYSDDHLATLAGLEGRVDYLIFGKEVGHNGTPHLQGFISFADRLRLGQVKQLVAFGGGNPGHWTVARKIPEAIEYCRKDGDVTEFGNPPRGPGKRNDLEDFKAAVKSGEHDMATLREDFSDVVSKYPRFVIDYVQDNLPKPAVVAHPLREWQQQLYHDLLLEPEDRKVIFVVDVTGNSGKSWFCHYYSSLHDNAQVILPGKKADMTYVLNSQIRVLFVDAPRSKQGEFIQYDFLEDVKNGYVFSSKYESRIKHMGKVHVVVMMNEMPDENKLSRDRYDIRVVNGNA